MGAALAAAAGLTLAQGGGRWTRGLSSVLPSADAWRLIRAYSEDGLRQRHAQAADLARLMGFLRANHGGERFVLATSTTQLAAPIIVRSGWAVMARGGFHGLDRALKPADLERLVAQGQLRFLMLGDVAAVSRRMGAEADWARVHGRPV